MVISVILRNILESKLRVYRSNLMFKKVFQDAYFSKFHFAEPFKLTTFNNKF